MENVNDLFNLTVEDIITPSENKASSIYKPTADKGKDGVYSSVIRFIAWHKNPKKSIMKKWSCWLVDPLTDKGRYVDCPSTVGQKSVLQDIYWKLKKSDSVAEQKLAEKFSRRQNYAAIVQIVKDDNQPDLVGKLMVFPFGVKIYDKIQDQMQPEIGTPHIPFDLFEGKPFHLKITKVAGFNNYDNSKFLDQAIPLVVGGVKMTRTPENMTKILEFLKENSPELEKYDYQEWDEDTKQYVSSVIANTVSNGKLVESVIKTNNSSPKSNKSAVVVSDPVAESAPKSSPEATLPELNNDLPGMDDLDENFDDDLYEGL